MMPALLLSVVTMVTLSAPIVAQATLDLVVRQDRVRLVVSGPNQPFVGFVLGSLSPQLTHYFVGLPPLLTDGVLLGYDVGDIGMAARIQLDTAVLPAGVRLFAQGVTLENGVFASGEVEHFAIGG